jgi:hypothetical protein
MVTNNIIESYDHNNNIFNYFNKIIKLQIHIRKYLQRIKNVNYTSSEELPKKSTETDKNFFRKVMITQDSVRSRNKRAIRKLKTVKYLY